MESLQQKKCLPCEGNVAPLSKDEVAKMLTQVEGWSVDGEVKAISRRFEFTSYAKTIAFVNAVAWVATQEGHHPDIHFGFGFVQVKFTTHAARGLTENDFICAAKVSALL